MIAASDTVRPEAKGANARVAFISLTAIPLSLLEAIIVLTRVGISINTLTLGGLAIAIGEVVDDAIIDAEKIFRRLREAGPNLCAGDIFRIVHDASVEVRSAVVYATFIVALVFLPVLTMSGVQGRLIAPLGIAYILAVIASLLVALTVTPALSYFLLPQSSLVAAETRVVVGLKKLYVGLLRTISRDPCQSAQVQPLSRSKVATRCTCRNLRPSPISSNRPRLVPWRQRRANRKRQISRKVQARLKHLPRDTSYPNVPEAAQRRGNVCNCRIRPSTSVMRYIPSAQAGCTRHSKLFNRPRTGNKDIDQPSRALRPVRAGRDIGDADDSPKEIERVEVLAYVAALDRALHERKKRFMNLGVGRFEYLLWVADERIQHGGDDMLRLHSVDEQQ